MVKNNNSLSVCWLRRDLRLDDNAALYHALKAGKPVLSLFIFDTEILDKLSDKTDKRVKFIHQELTRLSLELAQYGSSLLVKIGSPTEVWHNLTNEYNIQAVYTNHDYEPYATKRDEQVKSLLQSQSIPFYTFKDIVIFERDEVVKDDSKPYTVFTPFSKKWRTKLNAFYTKSYPTVSNSQYFFATAPLPIPSLQDIGFENTNFEFPSRVVKNDIVKNYTEQRDFPAVNGTSHLGIHLRFGTLSVRKLLQYALERNQTFVGELIWRDFYHQILWHFPHVAQRSFRPEYDFIKWENNETHFAAWCAGKTGYPLVDAGMRELNETGFMHNRVRMVVASFLTKHLLIDWRWGEAYFAEKLLDFDLAANNGGWQWAAGSGTDAAPYFRIFNPTAQAARFDAKQVYIKRWVPEFGTPQYPNPIVQHELARVKCLETYKAALKRE
jgi:deoxyribodipyrimidine photo-lyase